MLKPDPVLAICARCDRAEPVRAAEFSESLAHDRQSVLRLARAVLVVDRELLIGLCKPMPNIA